MQLSNNTVQLNTHLKTNELIINNIVKKDNVQKAPKPTQTNNIEPIENNKVKKSNIALKLEELNKGKVTIERLEETVKDIKKDKKTSDPKDTNNDGKVSEKEKNKKDKISDPKDTNNDGKVSKDELQKGKEKKALSLIKNIVTEIKKENKDIDEKDFKNISKMINTDIIKSDDSSKINKFLDNQ